MKVKNIGIRTQLFIGFLAFAAIIVALLWVFQIGFLNNFYRSIKYNEIKDSALLIERNLENDELADVLEGIVVNTSTNVLISNEDGIGILRVTKEYSPFVINTSVNALQELYMQTLLNGGEYTRWLDTDNFYSGAGEEHLLYLKSVELSGGETLLIVLNTIVTPVTSTVETLKVQLIWISAFMIVLSAVLAVVLSVKISKPIVSINEQAKFLGKNELNFTQKGSRETNELSETLNYANEELLKVEDLRRELIANVSHDLRTPLTMIIGYGEVMRDIPGENSPENVQIIIDEAERLKNLVNDLLDISKLEAGQISTENKPVNLTQNIVDILKRYDKLVDYNFDFYHGEDIFVLGDDIKLSQVVYNLVNNAINYTGEDKRVVLNQTIEEATVKIEVVDSGEGIAPDKINFIWDRYYKINKTHKRAQVGTGLGLAIVKNVIDLHGGSCGAVSEIGKGSKFWFKLPVLNQENFLEEKE